MELIERAGLTVVGLTVEARWDALWVEVPRAWRELFSRQDEIAHRVSDTFVGCSLSRTGSMHYELVGAEVSSVASAPRGMRAVEIPPQRYITTRHDGPVVEIADTFGEMHEWARQRGLFVGALKLDFGYTPGGAETEHTLFLGPLPERPWRDVTP